jgi:chromosome segregation ATPase
MAASILDPAPPQCVCSSLGSLYTQVNQAENEINALTHAVEASTQMLVPLRQQAVDAQRERDAAARPWPPLQRCQGGVRKKLAATKHELQVLTDSVTENRRCNVGLRRTLERLQEENRRLEEDVRSRHHFIAGERRGHAEEQRWLHQSIREAQTAGKYSATRAVDFKEQRMRLDASATIGKMAREKEMTANLVIQAQSFEAEVREMEAEVAKCEEQARAACGHLRKTHADNERAKENVHDLGEVRRELQHELQEHRHHLHQLRHEHDTHCDELKEIAAKKRAEQQDKCLSHMKRLDDKHEKRRHLDQYIPV